MASAHGWALSLYHLTTVLRSFTSNSWMTLQEIFWSWNWSWNWTFLWVCTNITNGMCGKKSVMCRNFRYLYMTDVETSEIYLHLSCGDISGFPTWQKWRNLKYGEVWNYSTGREISNFSTIQMSFAIYAIFPQICFVTICALLCGEKLT